MYFDEDIKLYEFKNNSQFNNHLDYLMRTDKVQKWTNEYTSKNESFTLGDPTDTGIFQFKLDTRKSLKENFYKQWKQDVSIWFWIILIQTLNHKGGSTATFLLEEEVIQCGLL